MLTHHSVRWAHTRINLHWKCYQIHTSTHSKFTFGWATIENSEREKEVKLQTKGWKSNADDFFQLRQLRARAWRVVKTKWNQSIRARSKHFTRFLNSFSFSLSCCWCWCWCCCNQPAANRDVHTYGTLSFFSRFAHPLYFHRELHLHKHPIAFCKWEKKCKKKERKKPDGSHIIILLLISMMLMVVVDRWKSVKMHEKSIINYDGAHTATATTTKRYESEQKCIENPKWLLLKMEKKLSAKSGFYRDFSKTKM